MNYGLLAPDEREQLSGTALTSGLLSALAGAAGSAGRPWGQVIANSLAGGLQGYQGTFDNALQSKLMQQRMLQQDQEFGLRNQELKMRMAEAQRQQDTQAQQQAMLPKLAEQFKVPPELLQMYPDVAKDLIKRQMIPQAPEVDKVSPKDFTPESLAKYRQTGDYAQLVPVADPAKVPARIAEYNFYADQVQQSGGKPLDFNTWDLQARNASASRNNINVNQTQEKEEQKAVGKYFGEQYSEIQKAGFGAQGKINRVSRLNQLLEGVDTGKLTPLGVEVASTAQSLGISIDPKLGNKQAAEALSNEMALELRNPSGGAGMPGALSDKDREFLKQMVPGIEKTPQGRKMISESMVKLAQREQEVAKMARNYRKKKGTIDEGFYEELAAYSESNPLFKSAPKANTNGWSIKRKE